MDEATLSLDDMFLLLFCTIDDLYREGQDLGSIQVALTEKVEELTLYAIEQHQRSESLNRQVQYLKSRLDAERTPKATPR